MVRHRRLLVAIISLLVVFGLVAVGYKLLSNRTSDDQKTAQNYQSKEPAAFNKKLYSLESPASPWLVVNKRRPLTPVDFTPQVATPNVKLRLSASNPEMQVSGQIVPAVEQLFAAAMQAGFELILASGYRSYQQQTVVYNAEVRRNGQEAADRESARPGHSEHQTGLAIDVGPASRQCEIETCFADMPEGQWIAANAYKFGFIIRYGKDQEAVTGYMYEPWHLRYVGNALAAEMHQQNYPPLETFFNLGPAAGYQ